MISRTRSNGLIITATLKVTNTPETPGDGNVKVIKRWIDENGDEITGNQDVNVTLKRKKMDGVKGHTITVNFYCTAYDITGAQVKAAVLLYSISGTITGNQALIEWDQGQEGLSASQIEVPSDVTIISVTNPWDYEWTYTGTKNTKLKLGNITRDITVTIYNGPGINSINVNSEIKDGAISDISGSQVSVGSGQYIEDDSFSMSQTLTAPAYTYTWTGLPENDDNGNPYKYYVVEDDVPGFTMQIIPASAKELGENGSVVTVYNKQDEPEESFKNLEINKNWLTNGGVAANASDSVNYKVVFEVLRQEVAADPGETGWLVKDTDTIYTGTWTSIGEYTVAPDASGSSSSTDAEGNPVFGNWTVSLSSLVYKKIYAEGSSSNKYYVYKVVEKSVIKDNATLDPEVYSPAQDDPTTDDDSGSITVKNTFSNEYGVVLPATGGPGTLMLYLIGLVLVSFAGFGIVMKKKAY